MVGGPRHREQQIGQAIEVDDHHRLDGILAEQQHRALGAAADGARQVQRRAGRAAPSDRMKCRSGGISVSSRSIQPSSRATLVVVDDDLLDALRDLVRRIGQPRAEREQIALQRHAHLVEIRRQAGGARHAEARLQLVDVAVGDDARIGLADARAVEQAGVARIAGLRVDLHGRIIGALPTPRPRPLPTPAAATALPPQPARVVSQERPRPAVAQHRRSVPHPRLGDHAAADAGRSRAAEVSRVAGKYPSFLVLAEAPPAEVAETWRPLGYNIRPKRLQSIAQQAVEKYDGKLPSDHETLLSFKGIGEYTAGAIRSFAFRERAAILDTNVARVLFRIFVGKGDPKSHAMKKHLWAVSAAVLPHKHVFDFNQALMDFGATHCSARKPKCPTCSMKGVLPISCAE